MVKVSGRTTVIETMECNASFKSMLKQDVKLSINVRFQPFKDLLKGGPKPSLTWPNIRELKRLLYDIDNIRDLFIYDFKLEATDEQMINFLHRLRRPKTMQRFRLYIDPRSSNKMVLAYLDFLKAHLDLSVCVFSNT
ncbi:hypothetical protein QR680_014486 [Steinernema hermaphroditum]|uniref:Uncharacterized protein n=1 Tax=Steinernema hermaphroditum TaxID=289476 RepID=A0AA39I915_9BILA|nr:hypothetical protein QR680_014486 [Steinernema hermaphroditum]